MSTETKTIGLSPEIAADLQEAADRASKGIDRANARKSAARVDDLREQNRLRFGSEEIGVSIIREFRGPLPE